MKKKELEQIARIAIAKELASKKKKTIGYYKYWIMAIIFLIFIIPGFIHLNNKIPGEANINVQPQPQPTTTTQNTVDSNVSTGLDLFNIGQYVGEGQSNFISFIIAGTFCLFGWWVFRAVFKDSFYRGMDI